MQPLTSGSRLSSRCFCAPRRPYATEALTSVARTSISLNGRNIRQTANHLQMTEAAVHVALHRVLKALAALYRTKSS
jgi:hypothetical protein